MRSVTRLLLGLVLLGTACAASEEEPIPPSGAAIGDGGVSRVVVPTDGAIGTGGTGMPTHAGSTSLGSGSGGSSTPPPPMGAGGSGGPAGTGGSSGGYAPGDAGIERRMGDDDLGF